MYARRMVLTLLLLAFTGGADAQDAATWQVSAARPLAVPNDASPRVYPAPDGHRVAYERGVRLDGHRDYYLCVLDAASDTEPLCSLAPYQPPTGYEPDSGSAFLAYSWSPDGTRIAVVGQPYVTSYDTDLWIFDVDGDRWTNLTDDSYDGGLIPAEGDSAPPEGFSVEVQPAWSPDGSQIAVERTVIAQDGSTGQSRIALIDAASGAVSELAPLPGHETHPRDAGSMASLAWSGDGSTLALVALRREPDPDSDGVWLVDAASGESERIVSLREAESALQGIFAGLAMESLGPLFWSPDGSRLLFWAGNPNKRPALAWPFWITLDSREITAVPVRSHPRDTAERRNLRPIQAAWSPDSRSLLLFALGTHPEEPTVPLDPQNPSVRGVVRLIDVESMSDVALGQLPIGPATAFYLAQWSAGGDAILNGYYLKLVGS